MKVAVGSPASFVATDVEYESHEGNAWVGAAMRGGEGGRNDRKVRGCALGWRAAERERGK